MYGILRLSRSKIFKNKLKIEGSKVVSKDYEFANQQAVYAQSFLEPRGEVVMCTDVPKLCSIDILHGSFGGGTNFLDRKSSVRVRIA